MVIGFVNLREFQLFLFCKMHFMSEVTWTGL